MVAVRRHVDPDGHEACRWKRCSDQLEASLGTPFEDGNTIQVLQNGVQIFPAMLRAIAHARHRIDLLTYIYWSGDIAQSFSDVLSRRAAEGVRVRVLLDAFGAKRISDDHLDQMVDAGVELRWFRPLATWRIWRNDKRTHRKILVLDDRVAFTGGVGIADEWQGNARHAGEWRDTHFRIEGPVVRGLKAAFLDNWHEAGDWSLEQSLPHTPPARDGLPMQVVTSSSTVGWTRMATLVRTLVAMSTTRVTIVTPYFVPDARTTSLLIEAVRRGVDVRIMVSGQHCDSKLPLYAGQVSYGELLQGGVTLWRYDHTNLHAKLFVVDGLVCAVGSGNLNHRSLSKDEECCAVVLSDALAEQLESQFEMDTHGAVRLEPEPWRSRSMTTRIKERLSRLLVEQL